MAQQTAHYSGKYKAQIIFLDAVNVLVTDVVS